RARCRRPGRDRPHLRGPPRRELLLRRRARLARGIGRDQPRALAPARRSGDGAPARALRRSRARPTGRPALARRGVRAARPELLRVVAQRRGRPVRARGPQPERVHRMDRLSPLIALALSAGCLSVGCDDAPSASVPSSRVVAVTASADEEVEDLCDVAPSANEAPTLTFPAL